MNNIRSTKGITLIALVITIIVLIILAGVTITALMGDNSIIKRAETARTETKMASIKEQIQTDILAEQAKNEGNISDDTLKGILKKYGTIKYDTDGITIKSISTTKGDYEIAIADICPETIINNTVVADGSWNGTVNTPKIAGTGLKAVYWNGEEWTELTGEDKQEDWNKWYDYSKQNWANAQSADGSMWVWIPRYEYKIDSTNKTIDVKFIKIGDSTTSGYTLHPAFTNDSSNGYNNGGWDKDLPGFWIAKYAAGYQNSTEGETAKTVQYSNLPYTEVLNEMTSNFLETTLTKGTTKLSYPVFKANTYAYNLISVGDSWLLSQQIDTAEMYGLSNVDSHMVKNSEWGAVAYLTHSKYGVNGKSTDMKQVSMNTKNLENSIFVNNAESGTKANVFAVTSYGNDSETSNDVNASSTKNMTGVFDLNGCVWERVAAYYKGGSASTTTWHSAMADSSTTTSTKYLTLYTTGDDNNTGEALKETAGWNGDLDGFISNGSPVLGRGGGFIYGAISGVFAYGPNDGAPNHESGFRVCLAF